MLLCCSPLLRGFLQNAHTRQALLSLLLLPILLWAGRLARPARWGTVLATLGAATVHTSFAGTLPLALLPRALVAAPSDRDAICSLFGRRWLWLLVLLPVALISATSAPVMLIKLVRYAGTEAYSNRYPLAPAVQQLLLAMGLGVLLTCWCRRLGPRQLMACGPTRVLLLFAGIYGVLQLSIACAWYPQITSRFADPVGLFLLVSWLAWLRHHGCLWAVLPALLVTLNGWLVDRLLGSGLLDCGRNDEFLCVPDRWPWQVRY